MAICKVLISCRHDINILKKCTKLLVVLLIGTMSFAY